MKWFDKWFERQCHKAWNSAKNDGDEQEKVSYARSPKMRTTRNGPAGPGTPVSCNDSDVIEDLTCYTFKLQSAEGGTIVQIMHYIDNTHKTQIGEWVKDLYIVPETKDLGEELTSILVQYKLKHM